MDALIFCAVLFGYMLVDALFAFYIIKVNEGQALSAASTGAFMYLLLAGGVLAYTANPINLIAVFVGSFIGTYLVVKWQKRQIESADC